jgi:Ca2+-binding EF-hand superfamily protein
MEVKESVLRKVRILITNQFDSPEEALCFFDSENEGRLKKHELKKMLRAGVESDFIGARGANDLLIGYDATSNDTINWEEFKMEIYKYEGKV